MKIIVVLRQSRINSNRGYNIILLSGGLLLQSAGGLPDTRSTCPTPAQPRRAFEHYNTMERNNNIYVISLKKKIRSILSYTYISINDDKVPFKLNNTSTPSRRPGYFNFFQRRQWSTKRLGPYITFVHLLINDSNTSTQYGILNMKPCQLTVTEKNHLDNVFRGRVLSFLLITNIS